MMIYHFQKKFYYCIAFIVINFKIGISQYVPASPCPQYFQYYRNSDNQVYGAITINAPSIGERLTLNVVLSVRATLPTKDVGSLDIIGTKEELVSQAMNHNHFHYEVRFPPGVPTPTLTQINRNGVNICSGSPVQGLPETTIRLNNNVVATVETSNRPTGYTPILVEPRVETAYRPTERTRILVTPSVTNIPVYPEAIQCGVPSPYAMPLIVNGQDIPQGSWPWLAAIFRKDTGFICGGNILSQTVVLTAAHCFVTDDRILEINNYYIQLGRHNLNEEDEDYVSKKCKAIYVHESYKYGTSFDADIAIAILERPVSYTDNIRPICLWSGNINQNSIVNRNGTVVGWGLTERKKISPTPKKVQQPVVDDLTCIRSNNAFLSITSNRTFCAGARNGSGPCKGDSGSSMAMMEQGQWMLRGTVSVSLGNTENCDLTNFVVYSDVAQFLPWIRQFL